MQLGRQPGQGRGCNMRARSRRIRRRWYAAPTLLAGVIALAAAPASADPGSGGVPGAHHRGSWHGSSQAGPLQVVASGLNQPKKITITPDGSLLVALSGDGVAPATCTDGLEASCLDTSGAIDRITPWGHVSTVVSGLPSVSSG